MPTDGSEMSDRPLSRSALLLQRCNTDIAADGMVALTGSWQGPRDSLRASYQGKFSGGVTTLKGRQTLMYESKEYVRDCSMILSR